MRLEFPKNFYWGAATSSHQVEGDNHNDWTDWEKKNAERLARKAESNYSSLPSWNFIKDQAQDPSNYISGRAADHYNRFREDFDIAKELNHNAHRFSIEWSRIEPEEGKFNEQEIEHYRQAIRALRESGMEPFVTLWHFTLPVWFTNMGGFSSKKASHYFGRYCEYVISQLKNEVKYWITINEPMIYWNGAYLRGKWPPVKKNIFSFTKIINNLIKSHIAAYEAIKKLDQNLKLGIAKNYIDADTSEGNLFGYIAQLYFNTYWNHHFLKKISNHQDFIGLNFYRHKHFGLKFYEEKSDMGWEIYPKGIYHSLMDLKKYKKTIYITENGLADAKDEKRAKFIKDFIKWVALAIHDGVDVRGYFHWSLLDNFEWDKGFWPKFGLVEVDYKTLERKIRPSAQEYAKICKENAIEVSGF